MRTERSFLSPIGYLTLVAEGNALCKLCFVHSQKQDETQLLLLAQRELEEYFAGRRRSFSVPLCISGTAFQQRVWAQLQGIAYGETISYRELARRVGNERASRAVGHANHLNPLPIFIPCHRVIGANGQLTGYAGGLALKRRLLEIEGVHVEV